MCPLRLDERKHRSLHNVCVLLWMLLLRLESGVQIGRHGWPEGTQTRTFNSGRGAALRSFLILATPPKVVLPFNSSPFFSEQSICLFPLDVTLMNFECELALVSRMTATVFARAASPLEALVFVLASNAKKFCICKSDRRSTTLSTSR